MRHSGIVRDVAVLSAIGIGPDERRRVLGVSVALSEAEVHWRAFFESLAARRLRGVEFIVSDDHSGLRAARRAVFTLPEHPRKRLRTSNPIERSVQQELKRRTVKVRVFPGEDALLRLVSAVRVEIDDKWAADTKAASSGNARMPDPLSAEFPDFWLLNLPIRTLSSHSIQ